MNTIENPWNPVNSIEISFKKIGVVSYILIVPFRYFLDKFIYKFSFYLFKF
jgi:hypothetical protein